MIGEILLVVFTLVYPFITASYLIRLTGGKKTQAYIKTNNAFLRRTTR